MKIGSLFAGIGGFDLAARWMGWSTSWYSEIDPYACKVMRKNFPEATNLGDITTISRPSSVDMLVGGFPCQDISLAGKGAGIGGTRSGLWSHYARLVDEIRPRWIVAENVSALRSRGLDKVLSDLHALGYDASWDCVPASYVGAPHQRDRIWIVAHPAREQYEECFDLGREIGRWTHSQSSGPSARSGGGEIIGPVSGATRDLRDAERTRLEGHTRYELGPQGRQIEDRSAATASVPQSQYTEGWWAAEPNVGRVAHGVLSRVDRLKCLGNAVVPQVPYLIYNAISEHEARYPVGLSHI